MDNESVISAIGAFSAGCKHNKYLLDERLNVVTCGICGQELNPMYVLKQLCNQESRYNMRLKEMLKIADKAKAKNKCKCQHCNKMTAIQRY